MCIVQSYSAVTHRFQSILHGILTRISGTDPGGPIPMQCLPPGPTVGQATCPDEETFRQAHKHAEDWHRCIVPDRRRKRNVKAHQWSCAKPYSGVMSDSDGYPVNSLFSR